MYYTAEGYNRRSMIVCCLAIYSDKIKKIKKLEINDKNVGTKQKIMDKELRKQRMNLKILEILIRKLILVSKTKIKIIYMSLDNVYKGIYCVMAFIIQIQTTRYNV